MSIKLQLGKSYITNGGERVGPMVPSILHGHLKEAGDMHRAWSIDGGHRCSGKSNEHIVSEWSEGPIRTVTRREVVPGVYDRVEVNRLKPKPGHVMIALTGRDERPNTPFMFTANELRSAAMIFSQIAEAMDDGESK